jgi:hypothetical protein
MAWLGICVVAIYARCYGLFAYVLRGAWVLAVGAAGPGRGPAIVGSFSKITYEFFLTHGPIYLGLSRLLRLGFSQNLVLGTPVAIGAALILHALSARIATAMSQGFCSIEHHRKIRLARVEILVESGWASPNSVWEQTDDLRSPRSRLEESQPIGPPCWAGNDSAHD